MRKRILFYSHDSYGLGHFSRSFTIASFLQRRIEGLSNLMVTGLDTAVAIEPPPGIDIVKLPGLRKAGTSRYATRHLRTSFSRVRRMRAHMIKSVVRAFDPHLLVVDNVPRGLDGELMTTLRYLRQRRPETRVALTLRDILDEADRIVEEWQRLEVYDVIDRFYDDVWIAGSENVYDSVGAYQVPARIADRFHYCGYVSRSADRDDSEFLRSEFGLDSRPCVLVSCGGGDDGFPLIESYVTAVERFTPPGMLQSILFLGPQMPQELRRRLRRTIQDRKNDFLVFDWRADLVSFLPLADVTVSMGGYNTVAEALAAKRQAIIVPRERPRREQLVRAERFQELGLLTCLRAAEADPPRMAAVLEAALGRARDTARLATAPQLDLAGLTRIRRRVSRHLGVDGS